MIQQPSEAFDWLEAQPFAGLSAEQLFRFGYSQAHLS